MSWQALDAALRRLAPAPADPAEVRSPMERARLEVTLSGQLAAMATDPPDPALARALEAVHPRIAEALARNPHLPPGWQLALARRPEGTVHAALADRRDLSTEALLSLLGSPEPAVRARVFDAHPDPALLAAASRHADPWLREAAARRADLPPTALAALAGDPDPRVRRRVAENPRASPAALRRLGTDDNAGVRKAAVAHPSWEAPAPRATGRWLLGALAGLTVAALCGGWFLVRARQTPPVPAVASSCSEVAALHGRVRAGEPLATEEKVCLGGRLAAERDPAARAALSRVLIDDAEQVGDKKGWTLHVKYHLEHIDDRDPDLAYPYALRLVTGDPARDGAEAIRWADAALARADAWTAEARRDKVDALYEIRAVAAAALWRAEGSPEARDRAEALARAWLEHAGSVGLPVAEARQLCLAAGSTDPACGAP